MKRSPKFLQSDVNNSSLVTANTGWSMTGVTYLIIKLRIVVIGHPYCHEGGLWFYKAIQTRLVLPADNILTWRSLLKCQANACMFSPVRA